MKIQPKTEEQISEEGLWPAGEYGFEVLDNVVFGTKLFETKDAVSKIKPDGTGGNDMIQLVLKIYNQEGQFITLLDYLLESVAYKLRHACAACGIIEKYNSGEFSADDFKGKTGFLKLKIDPAKGDYQAKNSVADYVKELSDAAPSEGSQNKPAPKKANDFIDDSIPF